MKVFKIEFTRFNSVEWASTEYIIHAENLDQMRTSLLQILEFCDLKHKTIEEECDALISKAEEVELVFPMITENILR